MLSADWISYFNSINSIQAANSFSLTAAAAVVVFGQPTSRPVSLSSSIQP
jgi:hypothetical protein